LQGWSRRVDIRCTRDSQRSKSVRSAGSGKRCLHISGYQLHVLAEVRGCGPPPWTRSSSDGSEIYLTHRDPAHPIHARRRGDPATICRLPPSVVWRCVFQLVNHTCCRVWLDAPRRTDRRGNEGPQGPELGGGARGSGKLGEPPMLVPVNTVAVVPSTH